MTPEPHTETSSVRWLSRAVWGFGFASFFSDFGHEAATAALPALLASMGSAPAVLGIIEGLADGIVTFAKLAGGFWADEPRRRKPLCVGGYLATGLSTGLFAVAWTWPQVLGARVVGWFARGVRGPARDAMLADSVPPEACGRAFGFHRAMDTAGAVCGPLFAMALVAAVSLRSVFAWSIVPGALSAVLFLLLVRPRHVTMRPHPDPFWQRVRGLPRGFKRFLAAVFVFGIGDFARTLLILRAIQLLEPAQGAVAATASAMGLYVAHNVVYALACYPVGDFADRLGAKRLLVAGYALGVATALLAAFATPSIVALGLLFGVAGLVLAFEDTLEGAITASLVDPALRGTSYGVLAATNGVGDLVSSALVGMVWSLAGPTVAFGAAALLCAGGTVVLALDGEEPGTA